MRTTVDKIGSVTRRFKFGKVLNLTDQIDCRHGAVIAARVLNEKNTYNQLEDPNGRLSVVQKGDVIVGALGHRNALHGYEGRMPESLKPGDHLNILNLGGVLGNSISNNPTVGLPFEVEVLGQVLDYPEPMNREGRPANISQVALDSIEKPFDIPIVFVAGTCMNAGKTAAACAIVRRLSREGMRVAGCKLTGVSLIRDVLAMRDYGAEWVLDFTDAGTVASSDRSAYRDSRLIFSDLAQAGAEVIVAETGDGILGEYGVQSILRAHDLMEKASTLVLCANDPVGVYGGVRNLQEEYGLKTSIVTGPATDNQVGIRFVEQNLHIPAINALSSAIAFGDWILKSVQLNESPLSSR